MNQIAVTWLGNSGFLCKLDKRILIFDDARAKHTFDFKSLGEIDEVLVFVSHKHSDHYSGSLMGKFGARQVHYIFSFDVPPYKNSISMNVGQTQTINDITIESFGSTDEGVSFLVHIDGMSIFHAGDFNLWHWRGESTADEIAAAEADFHKVLITLLGKHVDMAFFPVDPRMQTDYAQGAYEFIKAIHPTYLIPMHTSRTKVWQEFAQREGIAPTKVTCFSKTGQTITIEGGFDYEI